MGLQSPAANTRVTASTGPTIATQMIRIVFFNRRSPRRMQPPTVGHGPDSVNGDRREGRRVIVMPSLGTSFNYVETLLCTTVESPVGPLFLAASPGGLVALEFDRRLPGQQTIRPNPRDLRGERKNVQFEESEQALQPYLGQLHEYFAGHRRQFDFPLDLRGTDFQLACWRALLAIPYGETRSYGDIARAVGQPRGFRAVGMANNRNPIAIVVPCHRVIASDGTLCGYGGGLQIKRNLLQLERPGNESARATS